MAGAHLGTSHCKGMKYRVSIKTILLCDCGGYIVTAWAMTCLTGSRHAVVTQSTHINRYKGLFAKAHFFFNCIFCSFPAPVLPV